MNNPIKKIVMSWTIGHLDAGKTFSAFSIYVSFAHEDHSLRSHIHYERNLFKNCRIRPQIR